jgi:hypothetical protein
MQLNINQQINTKLYVIEYQCLLVKVFPRLSKGQMLIIKSS